MTRTDRRTEGERREIAKLMLELCGNGGGEGLAVVLTTKSFPQQRQGEPDIEFIMTNLVEFSK